MMYRLYSGNIIRQSRDVLIARIVRRIGRLPNGRELCTVSVHRALICFDCA